MQISRLSTQILPHTTQLIAQSSLSPHGGKRLSAPILPHTKQLVGQHPWEREAKCANSATSKPKKSAKDCTPNLSVHVQRYSASTGADADGPHIPCACTRKLIGQNCYEQLARTRQLIGQNFYGQLARTGQLIGQNRPEQLTRTRQLIGQNRFFFTKIRCLPGCVVERLSLASEKILDSEAKCTNSAS